MFSRLRIVLPSLRPAGGVVKVLDYATHARAAGLQVTVVSPQAASDDLPVSRIKRLRPLFDDEGVRFVQQSDQSIGWDELGLLSLPSQHRQLLGALRRDMSPERVVHIIQGVRHATAGWGDGVAYRLLGRPMARIATNDVVRARIAPLVHPESLLRTIPLGHPQGTFSVRDRRRELSAPVRVGYTTWKSDLGDRVAALVDPDQFEFRAIRETVGWDELHDLYGWADVFLGTPLAEEGFYMPALEAMEAGAIVIVPDAGGNMAFCRFGENCIGVPYEDAEAYAAALQDVVAAAPGSLDDMRASAAQAVAAHDLDAERAAFMELLDVIAARVRAYESGDVDPAELDTVGA